ncbi:uncharacterized protein LOC121266761 [Juglans microcarpa x Juglans regia]|uniref:uncharacterized protein LOC121266761 n=1 Tax=Juglans microcarpa x Juglans regia TaxID=2249226 RepID=UPI001B7ED275|nr:uncharacterized protein LOC121266761 [Juglans microcarpa x Juglans regia]XP_041026504.1 uncharacterized protein LOC121266761 [Juglans microcarpa x Juglans regia]XP_041026505.1 uncharacterized protein LOC121266761 [Juglans microcarpa x Juglans regia]XP_041026506.1 uncharacterized protein LOC121266761 [Juglans microcarpa x Juglans regia]XP_041026507.1 uncharacterized protein LOC121266761 [Juglans microcarpa x Juglans regia]XP_041026508.1 uncharacterized protein LOC121266761 [Juglans microcarp
MDEASGCASSHAWIWVIEALASFKEVDVSILHDLIKMAPDLPDNLGKNMREMLALRCLEVLFGPSNGITKDGCSSLASNVGFDISKSCEDVLEHIVQETSLSDLKMAGPELSKWDARPFIIYKRACMPKLALQQLKDSLLDGSHPYADSLKVRSGLPLTNAGEIVPVYNGKHSALTQRVNRSFFDTQHMGLKGNMMPRIAEGRKKLLENNSCTGILLDSKRKRDASATENMDEDFHQNRNILDACDDPNINGKRQKQFASSTIQSREVSSVPLNETEHVEFPSEGVMLVAGTESCGLAKYQIGSLEEVRVLGDNHDEHTASMKCGHIADDEFNNIQSEIPDVGTIMPSDIYGDEVRDDREQCAELRTSSGPLLVKTRGNESQCNYENQFQLKAQCSASLNGCKEKIIAHEAEEDMDHCCEVGISSDSEGSHNGDIDVFFEKNEFLSSWATNSYDPSTAWTFQGLCMKCNEGGQLLVCSTSNCPVMVHENCLGSSPSFDNNGKFYCPFCAYSLSISEYLGAKKKASLARKELTMFFRMGLDQKPEQLTETLHREKHNLSRQSGDEDLLVKSHENGYLEERVNGQTGHEWEHANEVNNFHCRRSIDDKQQAEPSALYDNVNSAFREEEPAEITRTLNALTEEKEGQEKIIQAVRVVEGDNQEAAEHDGHNSSCRSTYIIPVNQSPVEEELQQDVFEQHIADPPEEPVCALDTHADGDNLSCRNTDVIPGIQRQSKEQIQQEVLEQRFAEPTKEPVCALDAYAEETSEEENEKSIISNYFIRFRKKERLDTYPVSPRLRRKKVPWTAEEEAILKEGVENFSNTNDRNIPWKKILEFGGNVFLRIRTTVDLKDKWRNLCKVGPRVYSDLGAQALIQQPSTPNSKEEWKEVKNRRKGKRRRHSAIIN